MKAGPRTVIHAGAIRDAQGVEARPGSVALRGGAVGYAGPRAGLSPDWLNDAQVIDKPDCLLLPAMVNAHTHLELTDIGPRPYDPEGGFVGWVKMLRSMEPAGNDRLVASAKLGAQMCLESGVQAVGDITRLDEVSWVTDASGLWGFSYQELFGLGSPFDQPALNAIKAVVENQDGDCDAVRLGLQPHAPYSAGHAIYQAAASKFRRSATHIAETQEEMEFVGSLSGPLYDYVQSLGRWDDDFADRYGRGLSPVQWIRPYLEASAVEGACYGNWLVAHCNYVSDADIEILAKTNTSVAYCPIASEYFGHTNHRYCDMLAAGVNVCLGTDSIVCAKPDDPQPLGLLSAMRRLYQRDGTDPGTLLAMATTNGARALLSDPIVATFGRKARFTSIQFDPADPTDPLIQALTNDAPAESLRF